MAKADYRQEEYHNNRVAYYDSWVKAWIDNRMEKDKQLLTLSALAIGLLVIAFDPITLKTGVEFAIWILAALAFIATIIFILIIFGKNADYIEVLLQEHQAETDERVALGKSEELMTQSLNNLTKCAFMSFIAGVGFTTFLAIIQSGFTITKGAIT